MVMSCFWGMFMVSQFVYTLQASSEFSLAEYKAFELLRRLIQKQDLKKEAASLINAWWRLVKIRKLQKSEATLTTQVKNQAKALGLMRLNAKTFSAVQIFVDEIFQKKLEQFKKERQRVLKKGILL